MADTPELNTVAEYDAYLLELNNQRDALAEKINALRAKRDIVFSQETVTGKVKNMGAAEREAYRLALAGDTPAAEAPAEPAPAAAEAKTEDRVLGEDNFDEAAGPDQNINVTAIGTSEASGQES